MGMNNVQVSDDVFNSKNQDLILNAEEGGLVGITGLVTYTNPFFGAGTVQPLVILEDQTGLKSLATDEEQVNKIYKKTLY